MAKYRIPFYDTAIYYLEFESDVEYDIDGDDPYGNALVELCDDAWANFHEPIAREVETAGDWVLSDDPYDIVKLD